MIIRFTQNYLKKVKKLTKNNPYLLNHFKKQFKHLKNNPKHTGLVLHKLQGNRSEQFSMWIHDDVRALFVKKGNIFIFFDIVNHDEY